MKKAAISLSWYEKEQKKTFYLLQCMEQEKYNAHFCQSSELSVTDSGTGTVSEMSQSLMSRGDYVSHSLYWVTKLFLIQRWSCYCKLGSWYLDVHTYYNDVSLNPYRSEFSYNIQKNKGVLFVGSKIILCQEGKKNRILRWKLSENLRLLPTTFCRHFQCCHREPTQMSLLKRTT